MFDKFILGILILIPWISWSFILISERAFLIYSDRSIVHSCQSMEPATNSALDADSFEIATQVGYELHDWDAGATNAAVECLDAFHRSILAY